MRERLFSLIVVIHLALINVFSSDLSKGFIIKLTNDTIYGRIAIKSDLDFRNTLQFIDNEGKMINFSASEISAFYLNDDNRLFESKEILIDSIPVRYFLRCLVKGKTSLYLLRGKRKNNDFYLQKGEKFMKLENSATQREIDGKVYNTYKYEFIVTLKSEILNDCPGLLTTADKLKYEESDLVNFIEEVNICKSRETMYMSYASDKKIIVHSGGNLTLGTNQFWPAEGVSYGLGFYQEVKYPEFPMELFLSYGLGFEYGTNRQDEESYKPGFCKLTIPLNINYEIGHFAVQPYLLCGLHFINYFKTTLGPSSDPSHVSLDPETSHLVWDPVLPLTIGGGVKTKNFNIILTVNRFDTMVRFVYYFNKRNVAF